MILSDNANMPEANMAFFAKTEVCLVLSNKFVLPENDVNLNKLFINTKELLVSVLQYLPGETLVEALESSSPMVDEKLYDVKNCSATMMNVSRG